jgi:hypothetical protein
MAGKAVLCIAKSQVQADRIVTDLRGAGFSDGDISVLFPDKQRTRDFAHEKGTKMPEGAATGAATGGAIGGTSDCWQESELSPSRVSDRSSRPVRSWPL